MIEPIIFWLVMAGIQIILFMIIMIFIIVIGKKTHALIEFKAAFKGTPIAQFFHGNKYCEWKNTKPDSGLIEDDDNGTFSVDNTYVDKQTKIVYIPFLADYGVSLNVKSVKLADDLQYIFKEQVLRRRLKQAVKEGRIKETDGINTLRTSIDFSAIKNFVPPILPHNTKSKIMQTIYLRTEAMGGAQFQNIMLLIVAALGAMALGGIIMKAVL